MYHQRVRLSIVIPAFNEARRLPKTLDETEAYLAHRRRWLPSEIIVVDDGSSDETAAVVTGREMVDGITMRCLVHEENRGKGAAVRTGFCASAGDWILLQDADLATPISELDRLASAAPGAVAVGSRALARDRIERSQPMYRDFMGRCFNLAVRFLAVPDIRDTQCGFKLFPGELGRALAAVQRIDGFAFDVELLLLARAWGAEIVEVPVRWRHVDESRVSPITHSAEMLFDLVRLGWRRARGDLRRRGHGGG